jgi:predicted acetyltransferase
MFGRVGLGVLKVSFGGLKRIMVFLEKKNLSSATVILFCFA